MNPWIQLDALWRQLAPTLLQFLAALMPIGVFYLFDQGAEVLSMLAEDLTLGSWNHPASYCHPLLFLGASFAAAAAIWYSARTLISIDIVSLPPSAGRIGAVRDWLQEWWPRLLAWVSVSMVALCFFLRIGEYGSSANPWFVRWLAIMGLLHLVLIWPLWKVMRFRREWVKAKTGITANQRQPDWNALTTAAPDTVRVSLGFLTGSAVLLIAVWAAPIHLGRFIGTGALLSFAAMTWVSAGSLLMWIRSRTSIPTVFLLVVLVLICSHVMDNHHIRVVSDTESAYSEKSVDVLFDDWKKSLQKPAKDAKPTTRLEPVFIVATEGGGIRAAYWTALVLGTLQEQVPSIPAHDPSSPPQDFASHLFAISGISGGSVGAAAFDALLADGRGRLVARSKTTLGQDHLAPLLGGLLFPDSFQRFWLWSWPGTDRAAFLEESFETGYHDSDPGNPDNRLSDAMRGLWAPAKNAPARFIPHLLLNSTLVETGQRLIFSDMAITSSPPKPYFMDAVDAHALLHENTKAGLVYHDIPLSTAGHASARFTYSNPPGTLPNGQHFVDGGYFEDSGATTALELIQLIEAWNNQSSATGVLFVPVVLVLNNDPRTMPTGGQQHSDNDPAAKKNQPATAAKKTPEEKSEDSPWAPELLSPPKALMQTRSARGAFARRSLYEHQRGALAALLQRSDLNIDVLKNFPALNPSYQDGFGPAQTPNYIQFSVVKKADAAPLPLGWSLSDAAQDNMDKQINQEPINTDAMAFMKHWFQLIQ